MKKHVRVLAFLMTAVMTCVLFSSCGGNANQKGTESQSASQVSSGGDINGEDSPQPASTGETVTETFTWWMRSGIDSSYVEKYEDLPAIKYLTSKVWGKDDEGNDVKINLEFITPIAGSEQENYNTMLATGDYPDIMATMVQSPVSELYDEGIILQLDEYVANYMPNYTRIVNETPEFGSLVTNLVENEKQFLQVYGLNEPILDMNTGFQYRRDWIVKYGSSPVDGSEFSGFYTETNSDGTPNILTWEDNVVFPSGGSDPVYISDWEWMFEIFDKAIQEENITDGYALSLPSEGFFVPGDLVSAFGGGGPEWYKTPDNDISFGATSDDFRIYLQTMNSWYQNGWIDTAFPEHTDVTMFWKIDEAKYRSGKVGLWYGQLLTLQGKLDNGEGLLDGIVSYAAPAPINDKYGTDAQQNKEPYNIYRQSRIDSTSIVVTDKAEDKNLPALFSMLDYLFSEEGSIVFAYGLTKEQDEEIGDELYTEWGLTEGAHYTVETSDGIKYSKVDTILNDGAFLDNAAIPIRLPKFTPHSEKYYTEPESYLDNWSRWRQYESDGHLEPAFTGQLSPEDSQVASKIQANVREYMAKNTPAFIIGTKDPLNDDDWSAYVDELNALSPDEATKLYQSLAEEIYQ